MAIQEIKDNKELPIADGDILAFLPDESDGVVLGFLGKLINIPSVKIIPASPHHISLITRIHLSPFEKNVFRKIVSETSRQLQPFDVRMRTKLTLGSDELGPFKTCFFPLLDPDEDIGSKKIAEIRQNIGVALVNEGIELKIKQPILDHISVGYNPAGKSVIQPFPLEEHVLRINRVVFIDANGKTADQWNVREEYVFNFGWGL